MIVSDLEELQVMGVLDRGVPNKECIAILVCETIAMGQFGLMLGIHNQDNMAQPVFDHLFWFGDGLVYKNDWLFVFTGSGKSTVNQSSDGKNKIYTVHWGKGSTVFADSSIVPILFRVDAVDIDLPPQNLPQLGMDVT